MKHLVCTEFDVNNICINEVWTEESSLIPEMSADDGALIGGAIFSLMAVAYLFRFLRRNGERH